MGSTLFFDSFSITPTKILTNCFKCVILKVARFSLISQQNPQQRRQQMSWLKDVAKVIGGLICIGLGEACRQASFIALDDWQGEITDKMLISSILALLAFGFFVGGVWLIYEVVEGLRERRLARRRGHLRARV